MEEEERWKKVGGEKRKRGGGSALYFFGVEDPLSSLIHEGSLNRGRNRVCGVFFGVKVRVLLGFHHPTIFWPSDR